MVAGQVDLAVSTQEFPQLILRAKNLLDIARVRVLGLHCVLLVVNPVYNNVIEMLLT